MYFIERASRTVGMEDFRKVLETFRPSGQHSQEYREEQANNGQVRTCHNVRVQISHALPGACMH